MQEADENHAFSHQVKRTVEKLMQPALSVSDKRK